MMSADSLSMDGPAAMEWAVMSMDGMGRREIMGFVLAFLLMYNRAKKKLMYNRAGPHASWT
jgi:hypothetical protein